MSAWETVNWHGEDAWRISTETFVCTVVVSMGPRIAEFRLRDGENLLLWATPPDQYQREMPHRNQSWVLRGGHRLWLTRPGADEAEETYAPDAEACTVAHIDGGLEIWGAQDAINLVRKGLRLRVADDDTLLVEHLLRNEGVMLHSAGIWGLTCSLPSNDCRYVVPLGDGSEWNTATIVHYAKWGGGHGSDNFADEQFQVTRDAFLVQPQGRENKRMLHGPAGIIALCDRQRDCTFAIQSDWNALGAYPLGCNIATYVGPDNFMVEMETMGPFHSLKPGTVVRYQQRWRLRPGCIATTGAAVRDFMA